MNITEKISEKLQPYNGTNALTPIFVGSLVACVVLIIIHLGFAGNIGHDLVEQTFLGYVTYLFYAYPIGFIAFNYLAYCKLLHVKKLENDMERKKQNESHYSRYGDEEEIEKAQTVYKFLIKVALVPYVNVMALLPILFIFLPLFLIYLPFKYTGMILKKSGTYILEQCQRAIEKIYFKNNQL